MRRGWGGGDDWGSVSGATTQGRAQRWLPAPWGARAPSRAAAPWGLGVLAQRGGRCTGRHTDALVQPGRGDKLDT